MDIVSKPNTTAAIWAHFEFKSTVKGQLINLDEAICRICERKIFVKLANTSNLRSHLRMNHRAKLAELRGTSATTDSTGGSKTRGKGQLSCCLGVLLGGEIQKRPQQMAENN